MKIASLQNRANIISSFYSIFNKKEHRKKDFFHNGYPKYCSIAKPEYPHGNMDTWEHQQYNVAGINVSIFF